LVIPIRKELAFSSLSKIHLLALSLSLSLSLFHTVASLGKLMSDDNVEGHTM